MGSKNPNRKGCVEFSPMLSAYIDDELSPVELVSLAGHLKTCSACARELDEHMAVKSLLHQADPYWPKKFPGKDFTSRVIGKLREGVAYPKPPAENAPAWRLFFATPARVAAAAAVSLLALGLTAGGLFYIQDRSRAPSVAQLDDGRPGAPLLIARHEPSDPVAEYIREHALESSRNLLIDYDDNVQFVEYAQP